MLSSITVSPFNSTVFDDIILLVAMFSLIIDFPFVSKFATSNISFSDLFFVITTLLLNIPCPYATINFCPHLFFVTTNSSDTSIFPFAFIIFTNVSLLSIVTLLNNIFLSDDINILAWLFTNFVLFMFIRISTNFYYLSII